MAVNETRNLNYDLQEGLSDGVAIKAAPDRGGSTEMQTQRRGMNEQHGYGQAGVEVTDHLWDGGLRKTGPRSHR